MANPRWANWDTGSGPKFSWEEIHTALLMDIRDRLTTLTTVLQCSGAQDIPHQLRAINRNTSKKGKTHGH